MSRKQATAPIIPNASSGRVPDGFGTTEATKPLEPSAPVVAAAPGTTVPADLLLQLLDASTRRTERALDQDAGSGLEAMSVSRSASAGLGSGFESLGGKATSAQRLRSNPAEAVERRLRRRGLSEESVRALAGETTRARSGFESLGPARAPVGLERIIGRNMLMEVNYLAAGERAARSVGRVIIRDGENRSQGFGTGFLIAPGLLLTNNHVLSSREVAAASQVEFNYQRGLDGRLEPTSVFNLDVDRCFVTSPLKELDFTLVGVAETSADGHLLNAFGYLGLNAANDEVLAGECVSIIQHPKGDPKQVALRKNEVIKLPDDEDRFLHYQTDTNPGSSGSPVFNDGWEVVALHHSGKPAVDSQGNYLTEDGTVWSPEMGLDRIKWIANEGVRGTAIVKFLQERLTDAQKALLAPRVAPSPVPTLRPNGTLISSPGPIREPSKVPAGPAVAAGPDVYLSNPAPTPNSAPAVPPATPTGQPAVFNPDGSVSVTIPLEVTVRLLAPSARTTVVPAAPTTTGEEAVQIDPDYGTREGYDPEFLGAGDLAVPLPRLTRARRLTPRSTGRQRRVRRATSCPTIISASCSIASGGSPTSPRSISTAAVRPARSEWRTGGSSIRGSSGRTRSATTSIRAPSSIGATWSGASTRPGAAARPSPRPPTTTPSTSRIAARSTNASTKARTSGPAWRTTCSIAPGPSACG